MSPDPTTLFLCLLAGVSGWSSLATRAAAADSGMEWQFYESNDPEHGCFVGMAWSPEEGCHEDD